MNNREGISLQGTPARWKSAIFFAPKDEFLLRSFFPTPPKSDPKQTRARPRNLSAAAAASQIRSNLWIWAVWPPPLSSPTLTAREGTPLPLLTPAAAEARRKGIFWREGGSTIFTSRSTPIDGGDRESTTIAAEGRVEEALAAGPSRRQDKKRSFDQFSPTLPFLLSTPITTHVQSACAKRKKRKEKALQSHFCGRPRTFLSVFPF